MSRHGLVVGQVVVADRAGGALAGAVGGHCELLLCSIKELAVGHVSFCLLLGRGAVRYEGEQLILGI